MPLVYIEFISRRAGVSLEAFHKVARGGQDGWASEYGDDVSVLALGRSWRLGPEPEYMQVWYTPTGGLERLDFWEETFLSGDADGFEQPFLLAARIDRAGCYEPLREPVVGAVDRYYAEWFDRAPGATRADIERHYADRAAAHPERTLNLLIERIGRLAPDPRGLAIWSLDRWGDLEELARDLDGDDGAVRLVTASAYATFGKEQL